MIEVIEKDARTLLAQRKDQRGKFTSRTQAELSFYRRMYHMLRRQAVNLFTTAAPMPIEEELADVKAKLKTMEELCLSTIHNKKQLQAQCVLLQQIVVELRAENQKLKERKRK